MRNTALIRIISKIITKSKYSKNLPSIAFNLAVLAMFLIWLNYLSIDSGNNYLKNFHSQQNNTANKLDNSELPSKDNNKANESRFIKGRAFVLDGDSLNFKDGKVRLLMIDAPEYKQECLDANHKAYNCGLRSREFLINLVKGKEVKCYYKNKDFYNRLLGNCFIEAENINKILLKSGMAIIYNVKDASKEFLDAEEYARVNRVGIWQGPFELPKNYRKKNSKKNSKKYHNKSDDTSRS
jgi:endonuclease YncB( thermonuclease family)